MSRIGRLPVVIPAKVEAKVGANNFVSIKGPKGELSYTFSPEIDITIEGNEIIVTRNSDEKPIKSLHGTTRALIQNMVTGVSDGFTRKLEVRGVGYRAEMQGTDLVLYVGYSHPVTVAPPEGISFEVDTKSARTSEANAFITVAGYDKQVVGQTAANIRNVRPPEPYKGKGLRYEGEFVKILPGKAGKTA
ncbi:MAG: 50S ribosomal protein L6 [Anaerolineaceae bacterium]|nr:50S ribosomal protein L6 [Anaerolineaceae bacterium]